MDQLNFKHWIEVTQLVRGFQDSHKLTPLGKLGWWTVFSAKDPKQISLLDPNRGTGDHVAELRDSHVRPVFEEAAQRLSKIGFPRMHANVVIVNLHDKVNPITGGGVGGEAWRQKHGFTIDRGTINANIIIHEHAHMYWYNLPKPRQEFFKKYYQKAIGDRVVSPQDMWKHSKSSFDPSGLDKAIEESWHDFQEKLSSLIENNLETYFDVQQAMASEDEGRLIEASVLNRFGTFCDAIAKKPIEMERLSGYGAKRVEVGEKVTVERVSRYIINQFVEADNGRVRWEHKTPLEREELHDWVSFKPELLYEKQQIQMKEMAKVMKGKPSQFFAPHKKKEEIEQLFQEITEIIANRFGFGGRSYQPTTFDAKQIFPHARFYQTWMSRIGRRFKAGKVTDMEGVKQTFIDSVKSQAKGDLGVVPANIASGEMDQHGYSYTDIGNTRGSKLRDLIHQQGTTPSAYAGANIDELWAVSVEYAAMDYPISKSMKKLIYSTLTGSAM